MNSRTSLTSLIACAVWLPACAAAATQNAYFVGNSLTWDAGPPRIASIAASAGHEVGYGHHVQCGQPIETIWSTPSTCVPSPAPFGEAHQALPNHTWDVVSLQPFHDTFDGGRTAIQNFINLTHERPANDATRFLVYSAWFSGVDPTPESVDHVSPGDVQVQFRERWDLPYSDANRMNRDYFHRLVGQLRADNAGTRIDMVPVGDVLYELDRRLAENPVAGISGVQQLYRDPYHMGETGRLLAAMTFYSVMFNEHPANATYATSPSDPATAAMLPLLQDTVWDVVSAHPFTNVPEPTTPVMLGAAGAAGLLARGRRRR